MPKTWEPTRLGRLLTLSRRWSLVLDGDCFTLDFARRRHSGSVLELSDLTVAHGAIWSTVRISYGDGQLAVLAGIPNDAGRAMSRELNECVAVVRHQREVAQHLRDFPHVVKRIQDWLAGARRASSQQLKSRGWLSQEFKAHISATKPEGLEAVFAFPEIQSHLALQDDAVKQAVSTWLKPFPDIADGVNEHHLQRELENCRPFFDGVEKHPLTEEQAHAVICFDNRVLVIASAGSGKTSTMVAKAGYALKKNYFSAERMLLLAFNNDAADDLRKRLKRRLQPLGLPADRVRATTFHAFGLEVIGGATGKKPSLASWVDQGNDLEALQGMVDELKDADRHFRSSWDLFCLVFGQDLPRFGERETPEAWDRGSGRRGFRTLQGELVKSQGERLIADWLYYNGVKYLYEAPYEADTADSSHSQYRPDFYLPEAKAYLEHWALNAAGEPPPEFLGYKESMAWKRDVHAVNRTTLLETTMADLWSGAAFAYVERELRKRGVELAPNRDRPVHERMSIENRRLVRTIRAFLIHAKSNRLTVPELRRRLDEGAAGEFKFRHKLFLDLFEKLWERWEARLSTDGAIDFEDMLNQASDCIEQKRWDSPYELVMVDEFQDTSQARARLVAELVNAPGKYLFAVGDDWQSVNRFAGADLNLMTDFEARFGGATTVRLETVHRCPQALCDIGSKFVLKNPKQLKKVVRSLKRDVSDPVRIVAVSEETEIRGAVEARVTELAAVHPGYGRPTTVYILGRYRRDEAYMPQSVDASKVSVKFRTVHSAKGSEADHIILPRITAETMGFPSRVADDPLLQLVMPGGDDFEFSEERRLFYVALTRARQSATLITVTGKESPFITELVRDWKIKVLQPDGGESNNAVCPKCGRGFLSTQSGRYGPFLACNNRNQCDYTRRIVTDDSVQLRRNRLSPSSLPN
jgi:DNA helicase-4